MRDILWSEYRMPDGSRPGSDDVVVVDSNVRLTFDKADSPAHVKGIVIYGEFTVEDAGTPLELSTDWAIAAGNGCFKIGSANAPYEGAFEFTLAGKDNSFDLDLRDYPDGSGIQDGRCPVTGGDCHCEEANDAADHEHPHVIEDNNAFLMAMGDGASISIHVDDATKESWTQLDGTVEKGATELTFIDATGWEVGDRIAIASTDFKAEQAEERTIIAVSNDGKTVILDEPLNYMHYGEVDTYNDPDGDVHYLDMRAEVALLSRDVTIQGDVDFDHSKSVNQQDDQYGGHTMVMHGGEMYISGVELAYMGQAGILGRYPTHWHESGDVTGQYIESSSVHHSFNKGITIHDTQGALVSNNAVYETISHNYYLEERDTYDNTLIGNLGIYARHVGHFGTIPRASDDEPSNFYTTNGMNTWIGNHAAGSDNKGFYFNINERGPFGWNIGTIEDNAVHSAQSRGFYVNHSQFVRDSSPQGDAAQPQKVDKWIVDGLTVYKIPGVGAYVQGTYGTFTNSTFAEMQSNARFRLNQTIEDSLVVGRSDNIGNPETNAEIAAGRSLPGGNGDFQGFQFYDGPASLSNVMFDGFTEPGDGAIETSNAVHKSASFGANGITWGSDVAEANKISMAGGGNAIGNDSWARGMVDVDGSLTGQAGAILYQYSRDQDGSNVFNAGENYEIVEEWGAIVSYGSKSGTLRIDRVMKNNGAVQGITEEGLVITRSDRETATGIASQIPVFMEYSYAVDYRDIEDQFRLYLHDMDWGDSVIIDLGPTSARSRFTVAHPNTGEASPAREVSSMEMLEASPDTAVFRDASEVVHIKLVAQMAHGYLWPQPGVAMEGSLHSGVTVLVDTTARVNLNRLEFDNPEPGEELGPPPYAEGQEPSWRPANQAPNARNDRVSIDDGQTVRVNVIANDKDPDRDVLTVSIVGTTTGGSSRVDGQNRIVFTPEDGFTGEAQVTYRVRDGNGGSDRAILSINVTPPAPPDDLPSPPSDGDTRAPTARNDRYEVSGSATSVLNVVTNDRDHVTARQDLEIISVSNPNAGSVQIADDTIHFTPDYRAYETESGLLDQDAEETFTYRVADAAGNSSQARVTVELHFEPGVVNGWLFQDDDGSGTFNEDADSGQSGYQVRLMQSGQSVASTTTISNGFYQFDGVPAGSGYSVRFYRQDGTEFQSSDGQFVGGAGNLNSTSFEVTPGATVRQVNGIVQPTLSDVTSEPDVNSARLELGSLEITQLGRDLWTRVDFEVNVPDAIVVLGPLSSNGSDEATVRVRNVDETGFEIQIGEWAYLEGWHVTESVSWMAASRGSHRLQDGTVIEAGREVAGNGDQTQVAFETSFSSEPIVFTQVASANGTDAVATRNSDISHEGFTVQMQEEEARDGFHVPEHIDWIAVERSEGILSTGFEQVDHEFVTLDLDPRDVFLADMQTINGYDTATLRYDEAEGGALRIKVDDERSADLEKWHVAEQIGFVTASEGIYVLDELDSI
ncbi:MAG: Ig-like domain-containing protein [Pseudomonadota bacterium]